MPTDKCSVKNPPNQTEMLKVLNQVSKNHRKATGAQIGENPK